MLKAAYLGVVIEVVVGGNEVSQGSNYKPGILAAARRKASRATFSWMSPLSSKRIDDTLILAAQWLRLPFPPPIRTYQERCALDVSQD